MRTAWPVRSTGGAGFSFEDKVGAYFGAALLAEADPVVEAQLGRPVRLDFQVKADGWLLDDLLVTFASGARLMLSIKSNVQFKGGRAPADFVEAAWRELLGSGGFDAERDLVGLVTAPLPGDVGARLRELQRLSRHQDPLDLVSRAAVQGYLSPEHQRLLASFACPPNLASDLNAAHLLQRVRVFEVDFDAPGSTWLAMALAWCRESLSGEATGEALALWEALLALVADVRTAGGYLDSARLRKHFASRFPLRDSIDYRADWERLDELTRRNLELLPDTIGGRVRLPREVQLEQLAAAAERSSCVHLAGPSGSGKSAIAKEFVTARGGDTRVVWLAARDLEAAGGGSLAALTHPLGDVLRAYHGPAGIVILDGLDRTYAAGGFAVAASIVRLATEEGSPWRVLIPCQTAEWPRMSEELAHHNAIAAWAVEETPPLDEMELALAVRAFPKLAAFVADPRLVRILRNPKMLDLVARRLGDADDVPPGEAGVADWFWEREVMARPRGHERAAFLERLAERQADALEAATPLVELGDTGVLTALEQDGVCLVSDSRVSFAHDLYGDWARQQLLRSRADTLDAYLRDRLTSPLWHRAIRLYAAGLLEGEDGLDAWNDRRGRFGGDELVDDLFVESALYAGDPVRALTVLWPVLEADGGRLLRRLLGRLLTVGTAPDPTTVAFFRAVDPSLETYAASMNRTPVWSLWMSALRFLAAREDQVLKLALSHVSRVAELWLRRTESGWPLRVEAARIGVAAGRRMHELTEEHEHLLVEGAVDEHAYGAALAAAAELPDDVGQLARDLARRTGPIRTEDIHGPFGERRKVAPAWPDGPRDEVDDAFRKVCLETDALVPLMRTRPELASEVLLALLIAPPRARSSFEPEFMPGGELEIEDELHWMAPLYVRGPFLGFLNVASTEAIEFLIRLVNFATERWATYAAGEGEKPPGVTVALADSEVDWLGDGRVFLWYRGDATVPRTLASALMALEKSLYDRIDAGEGVESVIERILAGSRSVAFAGLLAAVGCREPQLLTGPLRPLIGSPEFLHWDVQRTIVRDSHLLIPWQWAPRDPELLVKIAHEWHALPHRRLNLETCALSLLLNGEELRPFYAERRAEWLKRVEALDRDSDESDHLRRLAARFDPANYHVAEDENYGALWVFDEPEELRRAAEPARRGAAESFAYLELPTQCRRILDRELELASEQLDDFWTALMRHAERPVPADLEEGPVAKEDGLCGGAAVLVLRHRDWLRAHPKRERWCIDTLVDTVEQPPEPDPLARIMGGSALDWHAFSSDALPTLWAEEPTGTRFRRAAAYLAMNPFLESVARFLSAASVQRSALGDEFGRLEHFASRWAEIRERARWLQHRRAYGGEEGELAHDDHAAEGALRTDIDRLVGSFVDGSLEPLLPPWAEIALPDVEGEPAPASHGRRAQRHSRLDVEYLRHAFTWLPPLVDALDGRERAEWIAFWSEGARYLARRLGSDLGSDEEVSGTPYLSDRWLLEGAAVTIVDMRDSERPSALWEPILTLGDAAHYWVQDFLDVFVAAGLTRRPTPDSFVTAWKSILDWVESAERWQAGRRYSYYAVANHVHLLGLDYLVEKKWTGEHEPLVVELAPYFRRFAERYLGDDRAASGLIRLLRRPAGRPLLADGLTWLLGAGERTGLWGSGRDETVVEELASLLDELWRDGEQIVRRDGEAGRAFRGLLRLLAARQVPLALELLARLASPARA
jgi:hypothetical protein